MYQYLPHSGFGFGTVKTNIKIKTNAKNAPAIANFKAFEKCSVFI